ncbi:MAG TPA: VOC family protein [Clostridia bacterium]|nr:VOC family protein [Clostridia bacterium]
MPRPIHFDLGARDPARAIAFYQAAFGWTVKKWDGPFEYYMIMTGDPGEPGIDGGLSPTGNEGILTNLTLGVTLLEDAMAKVTAAGGTIAGEIDTIPGVGRIVNCRDTEGNTFSLIEEIRPDKHVELGEMSGV